jgi:hypothetical protein
MTNASNNYSSVLMVKLAKHGIRKPGQCQMNSQKTATGNSSVLCQQHSVQPAACCTPENVVRCINQPPCLTAQPLNHAWRMHMPGPNANKGMHYKGRLAFTDTSAAALECGRMRVKHMQHQQHSMQHRLISMAADGPCMPCMPTTA